MNIINLWSKNEATKCVLPNEENNILKFGKNDGSKFKHPFYVCADFESTNSYLQKQRR